MLFFKETNVSVAFLMSALEVEVMLSGLAGIGFFIVATMGLFWICVGKSVDNTEMF